MVNLLIPNNFNVNFVAIQPLTVLQRQYSSMNKLFVYYVIYYYLLYLISSVWYCHSWRLAWRTLCLFILMVSRGFSPKVNVSSSNLLSRYRSLFISFTVQCIFFLHRAALGSHHTYYWPWSHLTHYNPNSFGWYFGSTPKNVDYTCVLCMPGAHKFSSSVDSQGLSSTCGKRSS